MGESRRRLRDSGVIALLLPLIHGHPVETVRSILLFFLVAALFSFFALFPAIAHGELLAFSVGEVLLM
jgi:hypothetical protein